MAIGSCFGPFFRRNKSKNKAMKGSNRPKSLPIPIPTKQKSTRTMPIDGSFEVAGDSVMMMDLRKKMMIFRDLIDLPACDASAAINQLVMGLMADLRKLYPEIVLPNQLSELKGAPVKKVMASFCKALKSIGDSWMANHDRVDKKRYDLPSYKENINWEKLVKTVSAILDCLIKMAREKFEMMDEDEQKGDYSPPDNSFGKFLSETDSESYTSSCPSPITPSSVLPELNDTSPKARKKANTAKSPPLWTLRVQAVGKLNPIDVKNLSLRLPNAGSNKLVEEPSRGTQVKSNPEKTIPAVDEETRDSSAREDTPENDSRKGIDNRSGNDGIPNTAPETLAADTTQVLLPPPSPPTLSPIPAPPASTPPPPPSPPQQQLSLPNTVAATAIPISIPIPIPPPPPPPSSLPKLLPPTPPPSLSTLQSYLAAPAPPPPLTLSPTNEPAAGLPPPAPKAPGQTKAPPPPPPPAPMSPGSTTVAPPPPPPMMRGSVPSLSTLQSYVAAPAPPPPLTLSPTNEPAAGLPPPPPKAPGQTKAPPPPPPPAPMSPGSTTVAPPPPPPMMRGSVPSPPSPMGLANGAAPPPPPPLGGGAARSLRPKKNTKLKRSSQMGSLYRLLKGKVEGSSLDGKSSNGRKGGVGSSAGGKQGMADALAEMTKRSAYFQQIEADVQRYAKAITEMRSTLSSFQTKDMDELIAFHKKVESVLEHLTDESQVLSRFEGFPTKKLETIRTAAALHSKLNGMITELQNWKIVSPVGQLLDKTERYFNKIKVEIDAMERTKDEEAKKFQSHNIYFDFNILIRIKEAMVDVSSSCMELALKERREAKATENGETGTKSTGKQSKGSVKMLWRAFQFAFKVYTFAGGHDDRADILTRELAHEIEADPHHQ